MFNKIISLCEKHGFLKKVLATPVNTQYLVYGPTGLLLKENLKTEWFYSTIINKDVSVFMANHDFLETFNYAKSVSLERLPFGIAESVQKKQLSKSEDTNDFESFFTKDDQVLLRYTVFVSVKESVPFFHQLQRQRRIWWRKCSPNPGRYHLTDIKNGDGSTQSVKILAKYPWQSQVLETITLYPSPKKLSKELLQFKDGKKHIEAHSVVSDININTMFLNTVCDAFDEVVIKDKPRTLFRFHRKLAPYKISFAISGSTVSAVSELKDLGLYLTRQLRTNHVSTLFLPSSSKLTLEAQWQQYDQLGIPYNVLLNENTLRDGIAHLRSRDTTLKEQVHVSKLVEYVDQLFKNY